MSETSFPTDARPVLVAHDLGAGGRRAADLGAVFARALGVRLHLVHAMDAAADADFAAVPAGLSPSVDVLRARIAARVEHERAALTAEAARLGAAGIAEVTTEHLEGRPWEAVVDTVARAGAQLVVVAAHAGAPAPHTAAGALGRLLGSTAERVVRHAGVPVAVAADEPPPAGLCAGAAWLVGTALDTSAGSAPGASARVDLDDTSRPPLATALRLAARFGGRVVAVHAARPGEPDHTADLARLAGDGGAVAAHTLTGPVAEVFVRAAESEGCGALVLGAHEHRGLLAKALGRDALGPTFRLSRVPVLCVPA